MIKRVNFTGRRRIPRDRVQITIYEGHPRTFDAMIDLDGFSLLPHAAVFLEGTCAGSTVIERFDCGEVGNLRAVRGQHLEKIEGENVFFALKVVDRTERFGRILGIAENIRPKGGGERSTAGRRGILPIEQTDLGQQVWKLEFKDHDVFLLVNKRIPGIVDRVRSDPMFYASVYPEIIRHVLTRAFEENVDIDEDDDHWPMMWLRFGKSLHPSNEEPPTGQTLVEERQEWVEHVVDAFCETHTLKDRLVAAVGGGNGDEL